MKLKLNIIAGLVTILSLAFTTINAQPTVKILPSGKPGILKILYVADTDETVEVKFLNDVGLITSDIIERGTFRHGFIKKYDVRTMESKNFWIEIKNVDVAVTVKLVKSDDGLAYVPLTEKIRYRNLVASNN